MPVPLYVGNTPNRLTGAETFSADTDIYHAWLPTAITAWNADIGALNTNDTRDTSTSSVLIGTGTKVFTVSAGKSFSAGQWLTISSTSSPANQMIAYVVSYSGVTLTVTVPANGVFGSGTLAAWTIALTAALPANTYVKGNILGTVSQTAGVPTGAIIETGSNANGSYTKWADGTMICSGSYALGSIAMTSASGALFTNVTGTTARTFAATFIAAPICQVTLGSSGGNVFMSSDLTVTTTTVGGFFFYTVASSTQTLKLHITAVGRWF